MRSLTIPTIALLTKFAHAQTNTTCPNQQEISALSNGSINSTGSTPFTYPFYPSAVSPWYLSILLNSTTTSPNATSETTAFPYLSVPPNITANACVYTFASKNATATGAGGDACEGVISLECREYLDKELMDASSDLGTEGARCGLPPMDDEARRKRGDVCRELGNIGVRAWRNIANSTCTSPSLPGVDLPSDYITRPIGVSLSPFNDTLTNLNDRWDNYTSMAYDLSVWQTTPYAVVASFDERQGTMSRGLKFACVRPGDVQEGSRSVREAPWVGDGGGEKSGAWRVGPAFGVVGAATVGVWFWL